METILKQPKQKQKTYIFIALIFSYLSLLAIRQVDNYSKADSIVWMGAFPIILLGLIAVSIFYFLSTYEKRKFIFSLIGGGALAASFVYGSYLHYENDLFVGFAVSGMRMLCTIGYCFWTIPLFAMLFDLVDYCKRKIVYKENTKNRKNVFIKYWLIIFACYLPTFLHCWPGNFVYDARYQMTEVVTKTYKIHHPMLHTYLMGFFYNLGNKLFGSVSIGFSIYTLLQMLILSAAFAYAVTYLYKRGVPRLGRVVTLVFYGLVPFNAIFSITATKDVLFAALFVTFFILILSVIRDKEEMSVFTLIKIMFIGVLMLHFRKNAMYGLLVTIPFFVFSLKEKKERWRLAFALFAVICGAVVFNLGMRFLLHAYDDDSRREMSSVPLQQMARVADYRQDMPAELYEDFLQYISEEGIYGYNPYLSDPVKGNVDERYLRNHFGDFLRLWVRIGLKYPDEYIESFFTNTMGYWYLGRTEHYLARGDDLFLYHQTIGLGEEIEKKDLFPIVKYILDPLYVQEGHLTTPVLGALHRSSLYCWILFFSVLYFLYKKQKRKLVYLLYPVFYILSCYLGPIVALRYIYCIIGSMPIVFEILLSKQETDEIE